MYFVWGNGTGEGIDIMEKEEVGGDMPVSAKLAELLCGKWSAFGNDEDDMIYIQQ